MARKQIRRIAGLGTALLTLASGLLLGTGVQQADAVAKQRFYVSTGFARTVPVRGNGTGEAYRSVSVYVDTYSRALAGVKVAVDGSKVKGILELTRPKNCSYADAAHLHELCTLGNLPTGHGALGIGVRAAVGAAAGRQGTVHFKVTATDGVESVLAGGLPDSSTVTVANGPDITVNYLGRSVKAPAGKQTALPLRISNIGSSEGKGVVVFVHDQFSNGTVLGNFSNCVYSTYAGGKRTAQCTFPDAVVQPNEVYQLASPFTLAFPAGAHGDEVQYGAGLVGDTWIGPPDGTPGTGDPLSLVKVTPAAAVRGSAVTPDPTTDIDSYNNVFYTNLVTGISADLAAIGGSFTGKVGKVGHAVVGVRNSGNTTFSKLIASGQGNRKLTAAVYVSFPSTVSVTSVPKACLKESAGPEGATSSGPGAAHSYECFTTAVLKPGAKAVFSFGIKPLKVLSKAYAGEVALGTEDPTANAANDLAKLYINAVR